MRLITKQKVQKCCYRGDYLVYHVSRSVYYYCNSKVLDLTQPCKIFLSPDGKNVVVTSFYRSNILNCGSFKDNHIEKYREIEPLPKFFTDSIVKDINWCDNDKFVVFYNGGWVVYKINEDECECYSIGAVRNTVTTVANGDKIFSYSNGILLIYSLEGEIIDNYHISNYYQPIYIKGKFIAHVDREPTLNVLKIYDIDKNICKSFNYGRDIFLDAHGSFLRCYNQEITEIYDLENNCEKIAVPQGTRSLARLRQGHVLITKNELHIIRPWITKIYKLDISPLNDVAVSADEMKIVIAGDRGLIELDLED